MGVMENLQYKKLWNFNIFDQGLENLDKLKIGHEKSLGKTDLYMN